MSLPLRQSILYEVHSAICLANALVYKSLQASTWETDESTKLLTLTEKIADAREALSIFLEELDPHEKKTKEQAKTGGEG